MIEAGRSRLPVALSTGCITHMRHGLTVSAVCPSCQSGNAGQPAQGTARH